MVAGFIVRTVIVLREREMTDSLARPRLERRRYEDLNAVIERHSRQIDNLIKAGRRVSGSETKFPLAKGRISYGCKLLRG